MHAHITRFRLTIPTCAAHHYIAGESVAGGQAGHSDPGKGHAGHSDLGKGHAGHSDPGKGHAGHSDPGKGHAGPLQLECISGLSLVLVLALALYPPSLIPQG